MQHEVELAVDAELGERRDDGFAVPRERWMMRS
jgi:hypothetical protein